MKKLLYFIFSERSDETFCCSGDKFRRHLNLQRRVKTCSQTNVNEANAWDIKKIKNKKNKKNQKLLLSSFICLSSND